MRSPTNDHAIGKVGGIMQSLRERIKNPAHRLAFNRAHVADRLIWQLNRIGVRCDPETFDWSLDRLYETVNKQGHALMIEVIPVETLLRDAEEMKFLRKTEEGWAKEGNLWKESEQC